ncbi:ORF1p [Erigeron breviscapus amalgavirus 2]|uniref:ORF1p n=1 Tax=Erigeron breviscapus amalgavirus 2 TaxID=2069323 RepID=UPI000DC1BF08|nr:ORF1p [Erigeron breviscapus amalgavirus 2]DAB41684.1 TPA_inf: ORF1p [Erigeron breviscapus amalgavirus 2]
MTGGTGPSNQVHLLGLTPDQEQEQLTALSAGLVAEGFPAAIFSRTAAIDCGYDFARFYRVVKSMDDLLKMDLFDEVLTLAVTGLFFVSPLRCTTKKFCEFGAYLKTTKGQEALHGAQKMKKYQAKVIGEFEPKDVVLEQIFNAQRADYAEVLKEERSNYDREIEALKKQIRLLEARKEERLEQIAAGFAPASYYSEPDPADVAVEAWEMYQNDARAKGKVAMSRYDGGDKYAVANFGNKVKRLHCLEYCGDDASRTLLLEYCKKKILAFRADKNKRQTSSFEGMLVGAGGDLASVPAGRPAAGDLLPRARGISPPPAATAGVFRVEQPRQPRRVREEEPAGAPAHSGTGSRNTRARTRQQHNEESEVESLREFPGRARQGNPPQPL